MLFLAGLEFASDIDHVHGKHVCTLPHRARTALMQEEVPGRRQPCIRLGPSTRCVDSTRQATVELHDPSPAPLQFSPALADIDSGHLSSVPVPSIRQATQRTHCLTETVSPIRFPIFTFSNSASIGQSLRVNRTQCLLASQGPSLAL